MASSWGSASILDPSHEADRRAFAERVAAGTGLDFYTVYGWTHAEGGPFDNPLGVMSGGRLTRFGTTNAAAAATVRRLNDPIYAPTLRAARFVEGKDKFGRIQEVVAEAQLLSQSPWGPWGTKGAKDDPRRKTYFENIVAGEKQAIASGVPAPQGSGPSIAKSDSGNVGGVWGHIPGVEQGNDVIQGVKGAAGGAVDAGQAIASAVQWPFQNWQRLLEIGGGTILLVLGIMQLAKASGVPIPIGGPVGAIAGKVGKGAGAAAGG